MTEAFAKLAGQRLTECRVLIANTGPWFAECVCEDADGVVDGRVVLELGALRLSGTVDPTAAGTFGLRRRVRIVGGGNGWAKSVTAKHYHNDSGVRARPVAEDVAREVGEQIGGFVPTAERVGADFVRGVGTASSVLEAVLGGAPWWVDYAGVTQVGPRPSSPVSAKAYEVLAYDPASRLATLAVDDLTQVVIGSVLTERLDSPQTVRELEIRVTAAEVRVMAWCGGSEAAQGRLAGLLRSLVGRATEARLYGAYRYRVVRMADERVELQAVRKAAGLPDVLPISQWPGAPGIAADLAPGGLVLVQFLEGDPTQPVITSYGGPDAPGFVPTALVIGGAAGQPAARQGDTVEVFLPPCVFSGTIGGAPATGVLTFPALKTIGAITTGSSKVQVAS